jgi:phage repressor protein C with HTH and peptisase S24 domain
MTTGERMKRARAELEVALNRKISQKELAKLAGVSQTTIADLERGRNDGSAHIAKIAKALNVNPIWLTDGTGKKEIINVISLQKNISKPLREGIIIEQYDTKASMGTGLLLKDQAGVISEWQVSDEWIRLNLKNYTRKENLKIITGFGDSMKGLFSSGDPVIIDVGINMVEFDSPYFFRVGNEGFIKRLQRVPGIGIRAISHNKEYESWTITEDMDFQVLGLVLKSWQSVEFN